MHLLRKIIKICDGHMPHTADSRLSMEHIHGLPDEFRRLDASVEF